MAQDEIMDRICSELKGLFRRKMKEDDREVRNVWRLRAGKPIRMGRYRYKEIFSHGESMVLEIVRPKLIKH